MITIFIKLVTRHQKTLVSYRKLCQYSVQIYLTNIIDRFVIHMYITYKISTVYTNRTREYPQITSSLETIG